MSAFQFYAKRGTALIDIIAATTSDSTSKKCGASNYYVTFPKVYSTTVSVITAVRNKTVSSQICNETVWMHQLGSGTELQDIIYDTPNLRGM